MALKPTHRSAHLDEVYPMLAFEPERGDGVYLEDSSGRRVLDFYGGHAVAALGYGHPRLTAALVHQAQTLQFQSNVVPMAVRDRAANALADFAPAGLDRVFFVNSGAEANENALKLALKLTGRDKVVAIEHGFHGRTAAAGAVTWRARESWYGYPRAPMDVQFVPRDDQRVLAEAVDAATAAIIIEPVQGLAGAYDFAPEFLHAARRLCDAHGAMLILDEVQTGMGRLGHPFGADLYAVRPDLLTTAKGLAGGFPAGAVIMTEAIAQQLKPGELGTTFGGAPVACAAIEAVITVIRDEALLPRVRELSAELRAGCVTGVVKSVRGQGYLLGLECTVKASVVRDALLARDILTGTSSDPHVLRLLPPLVLERHHVQHLAAALTEISNEALQ
jgi:acetylornithine/succinyldiaminopimelate/putrescine aminotransferase